MYDEFGNLKKKFRAKTQQAEAGKTLPGSGRAGWEIEELGIAPLLRSPPSPKKGKKKKSIGVFLFFC